MLIFTVFELHVILCNLKMMDTIFGSVSVRDEIIERLRDFLDDGDFASFDDVVDVEVQ